MKISIEIKDVSKKNNHLTSKSKMISHDTVSADFAQIFSLKHRKTIESALAFKIQRTGIRSINLLAQSAGTTPADF